LRRWRKLGESAVVAMLAPKVATYFSKIRLVRGFGERCLFNRQSVETRVV